MGDYLICRICYNHHVYQITGLPWPNEMKRIKCPDCGGGDKCSQPVEPIKEAIEGAVINESN